MEPASAGRGMCERLAVFSGGGVFGRFRDGCSAVLSADGLSVAYLQRDGTQVRFSTQFAPQAVHSRLLPLARFRNACGVASGRPVLLDRILPGLGGVVESRTPAKYARWPGREDAQLNAAADAAVSDGNVSVSTANDSASLTLLRGRHWFVVSWPALAGRSLDTEATTRTERPVHTYTHVSVTEIHPVNQCPLHWKYPLALALLRSGGAAATKQDAKEIAARHWAEAEKGCVSVPFPARLPGPADAQPSWDVSISDRELKVLHCTGALPRGVACVATWTPSCTLRAGQGGTTVGLIHQDLSTISFANGFFTHEYWANGGVPRGAAAHKVRSCCLVAAPRAPRESKEADEQQALWRRAKMYAWDSDPGMHRSGRLEYPIGPVLSAFRKTIQARAAAPASEEAERREDSSEPTAKLLRNIEANRIQSRRFVRGLGTFTAFADGRVRAIFLDRTIGDIPASRSMCTLLLASGNQASVALPSQLAGRFRRYIHPLLQFADLANLSSEQLKTRAVEARKRKGRVVEALRAADELLSNDGARMPFLETHLRAAQEAAGKENGAGDSKQAPAAAGPASGSTPEKGKSLGIAPDLSAAADHFRVLLGAAEKRRQEVVRAAQDALRDIDSALNKSAV